MKTLKNLTIAAAILLATLTAGAQTKAKLPSYRSKGYAGSVSFTDQYLVWLGIDTSHGYMFNEHHYLGAGAGFFLAPIDDVPPTLVHVFGEYKAYFLKKKSTPTAGIRTGICTTVTKHSGYVFSQAWELEPNIGWDWGLKNGKGLNLSIGATMMVANRNIVAMPKLSFGIHF